MSKLRKNTKSAEELEIQAVELEEVVQVEEPKAKAEEPKADEVSVIDNAVKNAEKAEVETVTEVKTEPKVRINPNRDVRTYIGDQWYNLKAGVQVSVPKTVKEKLQKAGLLSPL